jgi:uncharacterized coiled-coil protein SlyX
MEQIPAPALEVMKQNAVAIQRQNQRIAQLQTEIGKLQGHVNQLKDWFDGMGQEVIERPDGKLQLRVKGR